MDLSREQQLLLTRRQFFGRGAAGIGTAALASLLNPNLFAQAATQSILSAPHFAPKAKRVIYLFMSGGPLAHRPLRLQARPPEAQRHRTARLHPHGPAHHRHDLRPEVVPLRRPACSSSRSTARPAPGSASCSRTRRTIADDICIVKSMHTEAINHDPAITYIQTGSQQPGRPSIGAWLSYGLGSENGDLPAFIVLISQGSGNKTDQPLFSRLWGSGFLPSQHQGVPLPQRQRPRALSLQSARHRCRSPPRMLDGVDQLNKLAEQSFGDPEINTRIAPVRDGVPHADLRPRD